MLKKICSGGQSGADFGALLAAEKYNIQTGGWMPKGFKTLNGARPDYARRFNIQEHSSSSYPPRTYLNVKENDGTLRFAFDFNSAGELCTLKGINQYKKPYLDIDVNDPIPIQTVCDWIIENNIENLNVAGNSEKTYSGMCVFVVDYLSELFELMGFKKSVDTTLL